MHTTLGDKLVEQQYTCFWTAQMLSGQRILSQHWLRQQCPFLCCSALCRKDCHSKRIRSLRAHVQYTSLQTNRPVSGDTLSEQYTGFWTPQILSGQRMLSQHWQRPIIIKFAFIFIFTRSNVIQRLCFDHGRFVLVMFLAVLLRFVSERTLFQVHPFSSRSLEAHNVLNKSVQFE